MYEYYAPNEQISDAIHAFKLLFQPWRWQKGKETNNCRRRLKSRFFSKDTTVSLYFSARGALHQYLKALNLSAEDHILITPTCSIQTVQTVRALNLNITYVDCSEDLGMSIDDLKKKYHSKCKLLVIEHPFGITPQNLKELISFARTNKMYVLEDVRKGFDLGRFKDKAITTAILWSFEPESMFSSVYGGLIAYRGKKNHDALKEVEKNIPHPSSLMIVNLLVYKCLSFVLKKLSFMQALSRRERSKHRGDSFYIRTFPNSSAILLAKQLDRFNDVLKRRENSIAEYNIQLKNRLKVPASSFVVYPLLLAEQHLSLQNTIKKLRLKKLSCVGNSKKQHASVTQYSKGSCPTSERIIDQLILLPTEISEKQQKQLIQLLSGVID